MSLKKELGLNELIILCNITFYVNTIFTYNLSLSNFTFRYYSEMFKIYFQIVYRDVHYTEIERMELLQLLAPEAQCAK